MEKERERNIKVWEKTRLPLAYPQTGTRLATQAYAMTELNGQPLGSKAGAQSTEPYQPGLFITIFNTFILMQVKTNWSAQVYLKVNYI